MFSVRVGEVVGGSRRMGARPEESQMRPEGTGAERKTESVWKLEDLVAKEDQDSDRTSESERHVRDVGSEAGAFGGCAAASGCLWN